jgi:hypothetical protein
VKPSAYFYRVLLSGLLLWTGFSATASAAVNGPFDEALTQYVKDKVLDSREYQALYDLYRSRRLQGTDARLAEHFMGFMQKQKQFIRINYTYYQAKKRVNIAFSFSPTYAEDNLLTGSTYRDVLGKISQNDLLPETLSDSHRCGAASLLAAHFLLYGNFNEAFKRLKMGNPPLSYRSIHLAQDRLYNYANTDKEPGLVTLFRYEYFNDGRIQNPRSEGEVKRAAELMGIQNTPLVGPNKDRIFDRKDAVEAFWSVNPRSPLLVGVHLDTKTGVVYPPDERKRVQNHFVVVFQEDGQYWLANSGVLDNGSNTALYVLNARNFDAFVLRTTGTLEALTRL